MTRITRRDFIEKSMVIGAAGIAAPSLAKATIISPTPRLIKDDISLAQWALVEEVQSGKWKTLDFPKVARNDFGLNGIEFVNTLFEVPTEEYLRKLKRNANDNGVTAVCRRHVVQEPANRRADCQNDTNGKGFRLPRVVWN